MSMISLAPYVTVLTDNCPLIDQIILPELVDTTAVDTAALLTGLLEPSVSNRVYPYRLPVDPVYPSITYELSGSERKEADGYTVTRTDRYLVSIQAKTLGDLISVTDTVRAALIGYTAVDAAGGIEITDQAATWHNDIELYEGALEVEITHLAVDSQATPAVFIYPLQDLAGQNDALDCVTQVVDVRFVVLLVAQVIAGGVSATIKPIRDQYFNEIIGLKPLANDFRTEFIQGNVAGLEGQVVIWRDVFSTATQIHN